MRERLDYIDITKGFGIILVVLSHTEHWELMYYTLPFFVPIFFEKTINGQRHIASRLLCSVFVTGYYRNTQGYFL